MPTTRAKLDKRITAAAVFCHDCAEPLYTRETPFEEVSSDDAWKEARRHADMFGHAIKVQITHVIEPFENWRPPNDRRSTD